MISTFRTVAAVSVAALILVGGATLTGAMAQAENDGTAPPVPNDASQRTLVAQCSGGAATSMFSRAMDFQSVSAGTTEDVEGSQWVVKGPKRKTDTVLVTLTSMSSSGGAGELLSVALFRDGVGTPEGTSTDVQQHPRPVSSAVLRQDRKGPAHLCAQGDRWWWRLINDVLPERHLPTILLTISSCGLGLASSAVQAHRRLMSVHEVTTSGQCPNISMTRRAWSH